jgi:CheY-like chemotaxis protein
LADRSSDKISHKSNETVSKLQEIHKKYRILIVEDSLFNQTLIASILKRQGCETEVAENGNVAVSKALDAMNDSAQYDLILMDMQMPEMDGYCATRILRERGYSGVIVALTAHDQDGDRELCLGAGCDYYLKKPVSRQTFLPLLFSILTTGKPEEVSSVVLNVNDTSNEISVSSEIIISAFRNDPEMQDVISKFIDRLGDFRSDLELAAKTQDMEKMARLAHQMKGAAAGYGFVALGDGAARLEEAIVKDVADQTLAEVLHDLLKLCDRVR